VSEAARRNVPGQVTIGIELLRDLARDDPASFHHFLWANHLAYAATYELGRFAPGALEADRRMLFELLCAELSRQGLDPKKDIDSVFDAGCSLGYLLRHAETSVFPSATTLTGIDIDVRAVSEGSLHLRRIGSRVELMVARMEQLDEVLAGHRFDVAVSCGSLMYLDQTHAARAVASLLDHADRFVGLIDRAHPVQDNALLTRSAVRDLDETWIHNLDSMVREASGHVTFRQWQPPSETGGRGIYLLIAAAANPTQRARGSKGRRDRGGRGDDAACLEAPITEVVEVVPPLDRVVEVEGGAGCVDRKRERDTEAGVGRAMAGTIGRLPGLRSYATHRWSACCGHAHGGIVGGA
jgi:SAM-dependent methyltransferase